MIAFFPEIYLTASAARISPAAAGTKIALAGAGRFPLSSPVGSAQKGFSSDHTTRRFVIPLLLSSLRITRAKGQPSVFEISETLRAVASSLLPVPIQLITGTPTAFALEIISSLPVTVSTASIT